MVSHKVVKQYVTREGTFDVSSEELLADASLVLERELDPGQTNIEFTISFAYAKLRGFGMGCRTTGADGKATFQIKTNSTTTPGNTFNVTPTNGRAWSSGDEDANPFTADVTKFYVTNTGTAKGEFFFYCLVDATPGVTG